MASAAKSRIIERALAMAAKGGADTASMAQIASAAGISRQALYKHFPTREALVLAVTRHVQASALKSALAAANDAIDRRLPPEQVVAAFLLTRYEVAVGHLRSFGDAEQVASVLARDRAQRADSDRQSVITALADLIGRVMQLPTPPTEFAALLFDAGQGVKSSEDVVSSNDYRPRISALVQIMLRAVPSRDG